MTIRQYADDLFNEHSICQQYNHGDLTITEGKIRILRDVCQLWYFENFRNAIKCDLADILNEAEEILK